MCVHALARALVQAQYAYFQVPQVLEAGLSPVAAHLADPLVELVHRRTELVHFSPIHSLVRGKLAL